MRTLQIGPNQKIADGFPGSQVFVNIPEGNGVFTTAQGVHTGTGSIDTGQVTNLAPWVRDTYTVSFTAANAYEIRNAANTIVAMGAYSPATTLAFNGISSPISGAAGRRRHLCHRAVGHRKHFQDTLDNIATALTASDNPSGRSSLQTNLAGAIQQLDQASNQVVNLRGEIGARLSTVDNTSSSRTS